MPKYFLTVCALHRLETPHLREWIEYHRIVGVDHFYLGDNNDSDDATLRILAPYIEEGIVSHTHILAPHPQIAFLNQFVPLADSEWTGVIDLDEFLFPMSTPTIPPLLHEYDVFAGLSLSWMCFGSSGMEERPTSVLRSCTRRGEAMFSVNCHIKTIVRPSRVARYDTPHLPIFHGGGFAVNENRERVQAPCHPPSHRRAQVNHYVLRSRENFRDKVRRGRGDQAVSTYDETFWAGHDRNEVFDDSIWRKYGDEVTQRMQA